MSSSEPPDNTNFLDFLKSITEGFNLKDVPPTLSVPIIAFVVIAAGAFVGIFVIPDYFVTLVFAGVVMLALAYMVWQHAMKKLEPTIPPPALKPESESKPELEKKPNGTPAESALPLENSSSQPDLQIDYLDWVISQTNKLSLQGIDPKAAESVKDAKLNLDSIYTALLTIDSDEQDKAESLRLPGREPRRISALAQLNANKRLVLLGDPGSGKSTFVNFVALCLAEEILSPGQEKGGFSLLTQPLPKDDGEDQDERQPWTRGPLLPLRIILRNFAARGLPPQHETCTVDHLWQFVAVELAEAADEKLNLAAYTPALQAAFKAGRGLLLLDGLDEVPDTEADRQREQIKQMVESFARRYPDSIILVTSRPYAYEDAWLLDDFVSVKLAPFSPGQIRRFVNGWYRHTAAIRGDMTVQEAQHGAEALQKAIFSRARLQELAQIPLLLTFMASLHAWRGGRLPRDRQKLYDGMVDLLLNIWEQKQQVKAGREVKTLPSLKNYLEVGPDVLLKLLSQLAYEALASQPEAKGKVSIPHDKLAAGLTALARQKSSKNINPWQLEQYLRDRTGILADDGKGGYIFPHRTLQEYLAACHFPHIPGYPQVLAQAARQNPTHWREVLLLAGARTAETLPDSIWNLADALYPPAFTVGPEREAVWGAHLAGLLMTDAVKPENRYDQYHQEHKTRLLNGLIACLGAPFLPARERALAGQSLGLLGDPRAEVMTLDKMPFCLIPRGPFYLGDDEKQRLNQFDMDYDYWISQYPVSNAQFDAFVKAGGYEQKQYWPEAIKAKRWRDGKVFNWITDDYQDKPHDFGSPYNLPNHPVVGVIWYEALAFARWLRDQWHQQGLLPHDWGMILPSEAEWEKAARGGLNVPVTPQIVPPGGWLAETPLEPNDDPQRRYPWPGSADPEKANVKENNIGAPAAPGCFPGGASPYGVQDLSGSVWEWTRSLYGDYPNEPKNLREALNASDMTSRAIRGGSYGNEASSCGVARRGSHYPVNRDDGIGVRVVVSPFFTPDL